MRTACNEKGTTMIETIMYVGFLILLGSILGSYTGTVFKRYKTGRAAQQLIDLKKSILQYTAASEDYQTLTLNKMKADKALPLDMMSGMHALGGNIKLGPTLDADVTHKSNHNNITIQLGCKEENLNPFLFYIVFEAVPQPACMELLTQGQYFGEGGDLDTIIVNNQTAWQYDYSFIYLDDIGGFTKIRLENTPGTNNNHPQIKDAATACSEKDKNTLIWVFS